MKCPACSALLVWSDIKIAGTFPCPRCTSDLRVPDLYARALFLISVLIAGFVAYLAGARDTVWLVVVVAAFFPVNVGVILLLGRAVPPKLQLVESNSLKLNIPDPPHSDADPTE